MLLIGKIVDDFLIAGEPKMLRWLSRKISSHFTVGSEMYAPSPLKFNGAIIERDSKGSIRVTMHEFASQMQKIMLEPCRRKEPDAPVTAAELEAYQSLAGKMNWVILLCLTISLQ